MPQLPFTFSGKRLAPAESAPAESRSSTDRPAIQRMSVSELNAALRGRVESAFSRVLVEGELRGVKVQARSGHAYFDLADRHSSIPVFMAQSAVRQLRFELQEGLQVVLDGQASVYESRGRLQLRARRLEPVGEGALLLAFRQRRARLEAEGLTSRDRKRGLVVRPRPVAVVTSKEGAALRDILRTALRRDPTAHLILVATRVQGIGAVEGLVRSLRRADRVGAEVVLLARGGGSLEDLQAFNEEAVARAVASMKTPVVVGVGHESDTTLVDLVADVRASTPTAAAERVFPERDRLMAVVADLRGRLLRAARARVTSRDRDLRAVKARLRRPVTRIHRLGQRLDDLEERARSVALAELRNARKRLHEVEQRLSDRSPRALLDHRRRRLASLEARLLAGVTRYCSHANARFERLAHKLEALSPLSVLARGYAVATREDRAVRTIASISPGDRVHVRVVDGAFEATVEGVRKGEISLPDPIDS